MDCIVMDDASSILSLPDDPAILKQIIATRTRERDELQVAKLRLEMELLRLKKMCYGPRADRLQTPGDVAQLLLEFATDLESRPVNPADLPADVPEAEVKTIRRVRRGRRNLAAFDHLPVTRKVHDLAEADKPCPCCGKEREKIGEESSWQLEFIPGRFERIENVRIKYACKRCEQNAENPQITLAEKPMQPIDKGMPGPGLLAYVVASKFSDYLPLYRLQNIFERNGFEINRATQSVWCGDVADTLRSLYGLMIQRVLQSHVIGTDDTVMPMLAPEKTRQARMWVYVGDAANPYNIFQFTICRSRDGPAKFLAGYRQTLLADAYGGYDGVVVGNDITRAGCWAHARRKFVDAEKSHPQIAAEAVGYLLNQWTELKVFTTDGAVAIDNNESEREMKRICLNRKNSLFVGNERGGQTAVILSSFTSTCRRHAIDPQRYLTQLLANLPATPISQISRWLPDRWARRNSSSTG
jgi:transposase